MDKAPVDTMLGVTRPAEVPQHVATTAIEGSRLATRAEAITITDAATLEAARNFLVDVKTTWTNIEADRVSIKKPLDEAVSRVQGFFRKLLSPLEDAERIVKPKIANYLAELERKRQEEEARQRAEADRVRREQEAAAKRLEEEAAAQRAKAEQEARDAQAEADRQERRRLAALASGRTDIAADAAAKAAQFQTAAGNALAEGEQAAGAVLEQAQQTREAASSITTPSVARAAAPSGTSLKKLYKSECQDLKALCLAIGLGKAPLTLVEYAQGVGDRMAGVMKESFDGAYPGVKLITKNDIAQRTK
jgi:hypothetical protein